MELTVTSGVMNICQRTDTNTKEATCRSRYVLIIDHYIKAFLTSTDDMHSLQTVLEHLRLSHLHNHNHKKTCTRNARRKKRTRRAKKALFQQLPLDVSTYIITFLTIEDYAFSILLTCKYFHRSFTPHKSEFIMKNLVMNECLNGLKLSTASKRKQFDQWELCGSYAWINIRRSKLPENVSDIHPQTVIQHKSLRSTLFLLHFMYKTHFGDASTMHQLQQLILQLISTGGGIPVIRFMIYIYYKHFVCTHNIPSLFGPTNININTVESKTVTRTVADLLYEIYDDEMFFRKVIENNDGYSYYIKSDISWGGTKSDIQFHHLSSISAS